MGFSSLQITDMSFLGPEIRLRFPKRHNGKSFHSKARTQFVVLPSSRYTQSVLIHDLANNPPYPREDLPPKR